MIPNIKSIQIGNRKVGPGESVFVVAEISANHHHSLDQALKLVEAAAAAGADAVKLQTYTPDTMTLDSDGAPFTVSGGTIWDGRTLYDLYREASTPWEWHAEIQKRTLELGLEFFSSPFDASAVQFLSSLNVPAYKVASFELTDLPLIATIGGTGKPMIMSTGMATAEEIEEALACARANGAGEIVLLKCTSEYPAPPEGMNLAAIPAMATRFQCPVGLSDHSLGVAAPVAAVALGAVAVEKHITLSRSLPGPDSAFSLEPGEFREMVTAVRITRLATGTGSLQTESSDAHMRRFRRSLFITADIRSGEKFTSANVRSIRPGDGLHPRNLARVLQCTAARDIRRGTPLAWDMVAEGQ